MKLRLLLVIAVLSVIGMSLASAKDNPAYVGKWSNGRGERLKVTAGTMQFADNKAVPYLDSTRATDGTSFQLQITAAGSGSGIQGKFLLVSCDGDEMTIRQFKTGADLQSDQNVESEVHWFRDGG